MEQNIHILIVDDEESIRETFREFLIREGYDVLIAEDAETALELLENNKIDIVVSDILLPRISGVELLKIIHEKYQGIQVLMITGEPNLESASQSLRYGACDYLVKPVNKNGIIKAVGNTVKIKKLEDSNRQYRTNLENLVKERTFELETALKEKDRLQEQVVQQAKFAAVGKILCGIAHDINNTLSPIILYSEAILKNEKNLRENTKGFIKKIISSAENIEQTISKISNFNMEISGDRNNSKINIYSLLSDSVKIFNSKINSNKSIQIINKADENISSIYGNIDDLHTIMMELFSNAFDSMPEGGSIYINTKEDKENLIIEIADEGCGMTDDERIHCYDPFFTTKGPKHSGLGLSTVYGLIKSLACTLEIKSKPDKGTSAVIRFKQLVK